MTSPTDKELLEAAARAAGYWSDEFGCVSDLPRSSWNPLEGDGDALRLAVKLNITVKVYGANTMCYDMGDAFLADDVNAEDPYAATRRAIVRAAASMAKEKSE